jgi:hypothetical protein
MASDSKQQKAKRIAERGRPVRKASKRLADDLMRFEAAFEKLERNRMGLGAIGAESKGEAPAIPERDVQAYLNCLDEAIRQLAEEFSADAAAANAVERGEACERDASISLTITESIVESIAKSEFTANAGPDAANKSSALRGPNCQAFDERPCDALPAPTMISQFDTSAV